jgi:Class III cytochrome C family
MVKGRPMLRWAGILLVCGAAAFVSIAAQGEKKPGPTMMKPAAPTPESGKPDLIKIDTLAAYGKLELPPVTFFHDKHTKALLKDKKGCDTCHYTEDGKLSLTYKRRKSTKPAEIKDIYHQYCIGCHMEDLAAGKKSGPPDGMCRSCHNAETPPAVRLDAGFNKVVHFRHVDSKQVPAAAGSQDNCASCHHEYDQQHKKLIYVKGKEESCRACHLAKPEKGVKSLEQAAHLQCVQCHLDLANKGVKDSGPYTCAACHGAKGQAKTAKKDQEVLANLPNHEVPRLMAGQPDAALVTPDPKWEEGKLGKLVTMSPVAFDHQAHEKSSSNCRVCHHETMEACEKCHTLGGSKSGKNVTFEQAMHSLKSNHSCEGCHTVQQADKNCAGCHKYLSKASKPEDAVCQQCHLALGEQGENLKANLLKMTPQQKVVIAEEMLKGRKMHPGTYDVKDIPDKVVIKELSNQFKPVELNHLKHVQEMMKGLQGSKLAEYFHYDPGTMCQGCHHYSPPSKNPPACVSCHSSTSKRVREGNRPALMAAYHQQCMSCHKDMKIEKPAATACTECHQEKQK